MRSDAPSRSRHPTRIWSRRLTRGSRRARGEKNKQRGGGRCPPTTAEVGRASARVQPRLPESVEEAVDAVGRLILEDFDAAFHLRGGANQRQSSKAGRGRAGGGGGCGATHVDFGRLGEGADGMNVVVEDDDPDHHPQAEGHGLLAGEAAAVLPEDGEGTGGTNIHEAQP